MAGGLLTSELFEVEFTPGVWTDLTASLVRDQPLAVKVGRSSPYDGLQAGELTCTIYNDAGNLTPDNPLSIYWPNVIEGKRIRYQVTKGATTDRRFLGYVTAWAATDLGDGTAAVQLSATDAIGRLGQRTLRNTWVEAWAHKSATEAADCFPMDDQDSATSLRNIGSGVATATIVPAASGAGSSSVASSDQSLMLPGQVSLQSASGIGPVIAVDFGRVMSTTGVLSFAWSTSQEAAAGAEYELACGYDPSGVRLWRIYLANSGGSHTGLYIADDVAITATGPYLGLDGDQTWQTVYLFWQPSTTFLQFNLQTVFATSTIRLDLTSRVVFGGNVGGWRLLGKQTNSPDSVAFGGISCTAAFSDNLRDRYYPLFTMSASSRVNELANHYTGLATATSGSLVPLVTRTDTTGRSALDCVDQVVGTIGGNCYHDYTADTVTVVMPDAARPLTSTLTLTIGADDDASQQLQLQRAVDARPTRVSVSSAAGTAEIVDTVAEAGPPISQRPESYSSCAASVTAARAVAGYRLNRSVTARVSQVSVDLVHAQNDLWSAMLSLTIGQRITLASLPAARIGYSSIDAYVQGWTETWSATSAQFVLDCIPADSPPELRLDNATFSRLAWGDGVATVTGGTAVGTTANGTLTIATSAGPTLTTAAGSYPLDLNWNGERVTITSAPAGSSSPQTVTTTARGVAPTIVRSHSAGEPVEIWMPGTIAAI